MFPLLWAYCLPGKFRMGFIIFHVTYKALNGHPLTYLSNPVDPDNRKCSLSKCRLICSFQICFMLYSRAITFFLLILTLHTNTLMVSAIVDISSLLFFIVFFYFFCLTHWSFCAPLLSNKNLVYFNPLKKNKELLPFCFWHAVTFKYFISLPRFFFKALCFCANEAEVEVLGNNVRRNNSKLHFLWGFFFSSTTRIERRPDGEEMCALT